MSLLRSARNFGFASLAMTQRRQFAILFLLLAHSSSLFADMERAGGVSIGLHVGAGVPLGGFAANYKRSKAVNLVIGHWFSENFMVGLSPGANLGGHKGEFISTVVTTSSVGGLTKSKATVSSILSLYAKWGVPGLLHNLFPYAAFGFGKYKTKVTPADAPSISKGWGANFGGGMDWNVPGKEGMTIGIDLRFHYISGGTFFLRPMLTVEFLK